MTKHCLRPGIEHRDRVARWQLRVSSRVPGKWEVDCPVCEECAQEFRRQFRPLLTFKLATLEKLVDATAQN